MVSAFGLPHKKEQWHEQPYNQKIFLIETWATKGDILLTMTRVDFFFIDLGTYRSSWKPLVEGKFLIHNECLPSGRITGH